MLVRCNGGPWNIILLPTVYPSSTINRRLQPMRSVNFILLPLLLSLAFGLLGTLQANSIETSVRVNQAEVDAWNKFAESLLTVHNTIVAKVDTKTAKEIGSYGGEYSKNYRFLEENYIDKNSNKLLSRIRWHNKKNNLLHTIEIFIYDSNNKLIRDYVAAYLPYDRNAPFQTLINFHAYDNGLHAYRQFDASGERIFEKCEGTLWGGDVSLSLEDYEMPEKPFDYTGTYLACFSDLPLSAGMYLDPLAEIKQKTSYPVFSTKNGPSAPDGYHEAITYYSDLLATQPNNIIAYTKRAHAYLELYEFEKSIADYSTVIKLNREIDEAWFGRGLAYGRNRQFILAIQDLSEYIRRNPDSSEAYTKRGVRYIWMGKLKHAKKDLIRAIELDAGNAEANDDVGVLYAQEKQYLKAIKHFQASINSDPAYQKAYHNLALAYYLTNKNMLAMRNVNKALKLNPVSKNSTLLKAEILRHGGHEQEARKLASDASLMNESNWSEIMSPAENH